MYGMCSDGRQAYSSPNELDISVVMSLKTLLLEVLLHLLFALLFELVQFVHVYLPGLYSVQGQNGRLFVSQFLSSIRNIEQNYSKSTWSTSKESPPSCLAFAPLMIRGKETITD